MRRALATVLAAWVAGCAPDFTGATCRTHENCPTEQYCSAACRCVSIAVDAGQAPRSGPLCAGLQRVAELQVRGGGTRHEAMSRDGRTLAASRDGTYVLWLRGDAGWVEARSGHGVSSTYADLLGLSGDGQRVVLNGDQGLEAHSAETTSDGKPTSVVPLASFPSGGKALLVGGTKDELVIAADYGSRLWLGRGSTLSRMHDGGFAQLRALSPGGTQLLTVDGSHTFFFETRDLDSAATTSKEADLASACDDGTSAVVYAETASSTAYQAYAYDALGQGLPLVFPKKPQAIALAPGGRRVVGVMNEGPLDRRIVILERGATGFALAGYLPALDRANWGPGSWVAVSDDAGVVAVSSSDAEQGVAVYEALPDVADPGPPP